MAAQKPAPLFRGPRPGRARHGRPSRPGLPADASRPTRVVPLAAGSRDKAGDAARNDRIAGPGGRTRPAGPISGVHTRGATPVPIPNTAVKPAGPRIVPQGAKAGRCRNPAPTAPAGPSPTGAVSCAELVSLAATPGIPARWTRSPRPYSPWSSERRDFGLSEPIGSQSAALSSDRQDRRFQLAVGPRIEIR